MRRKSTRMAAIKGSLNCLPLVFRQSVGETHHAERPFRVGPNRGRNGAMRRTVTAYILLASLLGMGSTGAAECPPDALGVSRTLVVDPNEHLRLGSFQYSESLPLMDHEVVLTFDDGPLPPYTNRILDTLASECVKATFFMVGRMVQGYPAALRRAHKEGQ